MLNQQPKRANSVAGFCRWCEAEFTKRVSGGSRQKFCSDRCRGEYHYALRKWGQLAVDSGLVPVSAFRRFGPEEGHYGTLERK